MVPDPSTPPVAPIVVGRDHAYTSHHAILLSYFPVKVSAEALRSVHGAHLALRRDHPGGTVTLAVVGSGIAMPEREVRQVAAEIGREASIGLLGEGIVLEGHTFWVAMARSTLRAIQLVSHSVHARSYFDDVADGARWALERARRPASEHGELVGRAAAMVDAFARAR